MAKLLCSKNEPAVDCSRKQPVLCYSIQDFYRVILTVFSEGRSTMCYLSLSLESQPALAFIHSTALS